jgi:hypothetical protein
MKLIKRPVVASQGSSIHLLDRVQGIWKFGYSWDRDTQAQKMLVDQLSSRLDNSYTLVSNVPVPGFSMPVPLVLFGRTGLRTLCVSAEKGIFSLKGDKWYKLDEQKEQYRPSRPNLVRRTAMMSRAVVEYLGEKGIYVEEQQAVLFFTQPGIHIDASASPVLLLQNDEVDRFITDFVNDDIRLDTLEVQRITEILMESRPAPVEKQQPRSSRSLLSNSPLSNYVGIGDFQLKAWQWLVLFFLAIFMLITVILTAVIILNTA